MQTLKINLHGESWMLRKFDCNDERLNECLKVADKMKVPLFKVDCPQKLHTILVIFYGKISHIDQPL